MHLPLLGRVLFLLFQFLILTMALPTARHTSPSPAVQNEELADRDADKNTETTRSRTLLGRRIKIEKLGSPVKAMVRSPDRPSSSRARAKME